MVCIKTKFIDMYCTHVIFNIPHGGHFEIQYGGQTEHFSAWLPS